GKRSSVYGMCAFDAGTCGTGQAVFPDRVIYGRSFGDRSIPSYRSRPGGSMPVRLTRLAVVVFALAVSTTARAEVPSPTIEGPIASPAGAFIGSAGMVDLSQVGYEQQEYFISGTASASTSTGTLGEDGMWSVAPAATAAYKTRILVYRPTDAKKFGGTVIVEWLNVSGGVDANPDWTQTHVEIIREGAAWVGVSAQYVGVEGGG